MSNQAVYLDAPGSALRLDAAFIPLSGHNDIVMHNHALAINPIDHTQASSSGFAIKSYPRVLGQDVAGIIHSIGSNVQGFAIGDRVIAHAWSMRTGENADAAFQLYARVPAANAAKLPQTITFSEGVVLPLALDTAAAGLYQTLRLPWPRLSASNGGEEEEEEREGGVLIVYGGSSSVGIAATQLATASGVRVVAIASEKNHGLAKEVGAEQVFDQKDADLVEKVVGAVGKDKLVGIFDAIAVDATYKHDLEILEKFGGGDLIITHPPPKDLPESVKATFILGLGEFSFPLWKDFIPQALESGQLKARPEPLVVGKGLESVQKALEVYAAGVSGKKVVVEL
ncbi:Putative GroES-like superfamily, alcohol dehydrogenase-like, NAD(P)-binding domain superfamily [Septoria linicola]|uniref:GroES-like superfamily, alcohol dehydrogenase-like, NAD(P)-binding domain superfamily n=1 Tax=Septoria linicola TaxID=215465 RepID=A0A9Q9B0C9_9PEZI|nr:Putative GroES-like superfamily, alcohol dehydrogenase-like, NAD(P)-binding domain superfamily [Septoria linicola]